MGNCIFNAWTVSGNAVPPAPADLLAMFPVDFESIYTSI